MHTLVLKFLAFLTAVLALCAAAGCSRTSYMNRTVRPLDESVRLQIRRLEVAQSKRVSTAVMQEPWTTENAFGNGLAQGAAVGVILPMTMRPDAIILAPVSAPIGAAIGAVAGSANAKSVEEVRTQRERITALMAPIDPARSMAERLAWKVGRDAKLPSAFERSSADTTHARVIDGLYLVQTDADRFGLEAADLGGDPPLYPFVVMRVRLSEATTGRQAGEWFYEDRGNSRKFAEWAAMTDAAVHEEFEQLAERVAERAKVEIFLLHRI